MHYTKDEQPISQSQTPCNYAEIMHQQKAILSVNENHKPNRYISHSVHSLHQLNRWHSGLRRQFLERPRRGNIDGTHLDIGIDINGGSILDQHCGKIRTRAVILRVVNDGATPAPGAGHRRRGPAPRALIRGHRDGCIGVNISAGLLGLQVRQGLGEITGVDFLIRWILVAHHPAVRRAGRRRDEEKLVVLRGFEESWAERVLLVEDRGGFAVVGLWADGVAQEGLVVEGLAGGYCVGFIVEGADYSTERGEW